MKIDEERAHRRRKGKTTTTKTAIIFCNINRPEKRKKGEKINNRLAVAGAACRDRSEN